MQNSYWCLRVSVRPSLSRYAEKYIIQKSQCHFLFFKRNFYLLHFINTRTIRTSSRCPGCASRGRRPPEQPPLPEKSRLFRPPPSRAAAAAGRSAASTPTAAGAALASITTLLLPAASRPRRHSLRPPAGPLAKAQGRCPAPTSGLLPLPGPSLAAWLGHPDCTLHSPPLCVVYGSPSLWLRSRTCLFLGEML